MRLQNLGYWMPLFVRPVSGAELTDALVERITSAVRERASPRHVPDDVVAVDTIPHTITGKKLEVPVKRIMQGVDVADAVDAGAVDAPDSLAWFARYYTDRAGRTPEVASRG